MLRNGPSKIFSVSFLLAVILSVAILGLSGTARASGVGTNYYFLDCSPKGPSGSPEPPIVVFGALPTATATCEAGNVVATAEYGGEFGSPIAIDVPTSVGVVYVFGTPPFGVDYVLKDESTGTVLATGSGTIAGIGTSASCEKAVGINLGGTATEGAVITNGDDISLTLKFTGGTTGTVCTGDFSGAEDINHATNVHVHTGLPPAVPEFSTLSIVPAAVSLLLIALLRTRVAKSRLVG